MADALKKSLSTTNPKLMNNGLYAELLHTLIECLDCIPQADYPVHSRIHPLRSFSFPHTTCFVKRDDELGFGISGSKIRKYRSLIPFLLHTQQQEVVVIGSAYSNHVLSFTQLLIENGIQPTLFLRGDPQRPPQGNALLLSFFVSPSAIHWLSKEQWKHAENQAYAYAQQQKHATFVLPEGGFTTAALPGALSLVLDLLQNEHDHQLAFDHIMIDAGTGFMASALLLGLSWLQHPATVHVILLAEDQAAFLTRLTQCHEIFKQLLKKDLEFPQNFKLYLPALTGKFGQIQSHLFQTITQLAQTEGFLTDPIYSAKHFIECRHIFAQQDIQGQVLIHHSGGALTLFGFHNQFKINALK